jgi:hypothetical protein
LVEVVSTGALSDNRAISSLIYPAYPDLSAGIAIR